MRLLYVLSAAALAVAGSAHAASIEIKDAVVRIIVIPEARGDIQVQVLSPNSRLPLKVRIQDDRVIIDGSLQRKIRSCGSAASGSTVQVAGLGVVAYRDMPQVVLRTPLDVRIGAGGAVFGSIGKSASLQLSNAGCGDWTIANVKGRLKIDQAGSGDTRTGSAGEAALRVAGSGDISTQAIGGGMSVDIAGSGDVKAASINGPLDVKTAGSGDVFVAGGHGGAMTASVAGSGSVTFHGVVQSLKARVTGSGDIRVKAVTGAVSKAVVGSGSVTIG
jgi:hypothetical protein